MLATTSSHPKQPGCSPEKACALSDGHGAMAVGNAADRPLFLKERNQLQLPQTAPTDVILAEGGVEPIQANHPHMALTKALEHVPPFFELPYRGRVVEAEIVHALVEGGIPRIHPEEQLALGLIQVGDIEGLAEIDDNAQLSEGNDNGRYVAAWVWVGFGGTKYDKEKGEDDERHEATETTE